jgi:hypothetical protein
MPRLVCSPLEHTVYQQGSGNAFLLIGVYVDDLAIRRTNTDDIQEFKAYTHRIFKMSDPVILYYLVR